MDHNRCLDLRDHLQTTAFQASGIDIGGLAKLTENTSLAPEPGLALAKFDQFGQIRSCLYRRPILGQQAGHPQLAPLCSRVFTLNLRC